MLPPETQFFIGLILILFGKMNFPFTPKSAAQGPTILTTVGILATFIGIATGLLHFDAKNIQESVPALLDGIKTAFWASVFGVGCAVLLKGREYLGWVSTGKSGEPQPDEITAADLARLLKSINSALVGSDEGSLISQLKLTRQDSNDRLDALKAAQTAALEKLSEMGTKTLIEALREVIRDFNAKITEQFGENFKQLNAAVFKLVEWQENYRLHIEQINVSFQANAERLSEIAELTDKATDNYAEVVDKSKSFAQTATALGELLTSITTQKEQFAEVSERLANLLLAASGSLPEVEKKILELAQQLNVGVTDGMKLIRDGIEGAHQETLKSQSEITRRMNAAMEESQASVRRTLEAAHQSFIETGTKHAELANETIRQTSAGVAEGMKSIREGIQSAHQETLKSHTEMTKRINAAIEENQASLQKTLQAAHQSFVDTITKNDEHAGDMIRQTKEQIKALDKALTEELEKSLSSLGRQLTALSERFVEDYTPLTERLKKLVEAGR